MRPPKCERRANSSSTCSGLKSPINSAPRSRCSVDTVSVAPNVCPMRNSEKRLPAATLGRTLALRLAAAGVGPGSAPCRYRSQRRVGDRCLEHALAVLDRSVYQVGHISRWKVAIPTSVGAVGDFSPTLLDE